MAAHYVPGSPSGVKSLELKVWLHIMCLAALQAVSDLGKCGCTLCAWQPFRRYQTLLGKRGCTLCAWQPFRRYQSLASVAAHYVPGSPSSVIRAWQAWLHIMCLAAFQALSDLAWQAWLHIMSLAAPQAISELGKRGCAFCAWQPFRHN